ncbi:MAG: hypothetical protein IK104_02530 [Clostridia bacterium]|nr:hypothetical protein [Clostridia bacterium]
MKKASKILAVVLSVLMLASLLPIAVFAGEKEDSRVASWKANDALLLETLLNNDKFVSYRYVSENMEALNNTAAVYTAFALYDNAWKNYVDHNVDIEDAEEILLAIIERAEYSFDDGYVDEIIKVLETASDVNDFIQKVNQYANIEMFASSGWSTAFDVINGVIKVGNMYQTYRDKFIAAYAKALSVQRANAYYIDLLQYVADNTDYAVLKTAAENLIADMNASVESVLAEIAAEAAGNTGATALNYLAKLAMNSNVYTAVALKVYQVGTSVADALWNTGDTYALIDTVRTTYYFQPLAAEYARLAINGTDTDKALVATDLLLTTRQVCEQALYDLKLAENEGLINKIKSKLYGTIYEEIDMSLGAIALIRDVLFADEVRTEKYVRAIYVDGVVTVTVNNNGAKVVSVPNNYPAQFNAAGAAASVYSEYAKTYMKVVFLTAAYDVELTATANDAVTVKMDVLEDNGAVNDWSFTDREVTAGQTITFGTAAARPVYTVSGESGSYAFNDEFVPSEHKSPTAAEVVSATTEVATEKAKSFGDLIKEFFENLFAKLFSIFKK